MKNYIEITEVEAKEIYCKGGQIYTSDNGTDFFRVPCSYEYGSSAPAEQLFYRSTNGDKGFYVRSQNVYFMEVKQ